MISKKSHPVSFSVLSAFLFLRPPSLYLFAQVSSNRARDPSMKRAGCQATATVTEQCIRTLRHPLPCWKSITHFCMHYGQRRATGRLLATSAAAVGPALPPCPFCSYHAPVKEEGWDLKTPKRLFLRWRSVLLNALAGRLLSWGLQGSMGVFARLTQSMCRLWFWKL